MKLKHTTTTAMQAAAKKGIALVDEKKVKKNEVDSLAHAGAKKIAAGQKLSDDHVRAMADYHHGHAGSCPTEPGPQTAEDLMWGGPAGALWSGSRVAAMDAAVLADDTIDLNKLFETGTALSFEIFGSTDGEKIELDEDDDGLLWAPILRSGTLAVRPGPGGQKIAEPLTFVPGHSADARKEIGLEDLKDAFDAGAVQHVTIPTNHQNGVLDNTGFIEAMKISDSTLRTGEKVLMGGHRFTEPDVKEKIMRGTIANRSCGILYDYTNTESGTTFGAVVEHVCLTNRPFVPGMEPYGALQDLDFSNRTVVPLMLAESAPAKENKTDKPSEDNWDGSPNLFTDEQYQSSCLIDRKNGKPVKERCALPLSDPSGELNEKGVEAAAAMIGKISGVSLDEKRSAAKKLVEHYNQLNKTPPRSIAKMASVSTEMSDEALRQELQLADVAWGDGVSLNDIKAQLVDQLRDMRKTPNDEYGGPIFFVEDVQTSPYKARVCCDYGDYLSDDNEDNWVIPFTVGDDGKVELSEFSEWEPVKKEWVVDEPTKTERDELAALLNTPPSPTPATTLSDLPADPLERAAQERLTLSREQPTHTTGGRSMSLTREQIGTMDLSDENRTILLRDLEQRERDQAELNTRREKDKESEVKTYLSDLSKKGFEGAPGFLREVERALLGDDGKPAVRLDLTDDGGTKEQVVTITDVVKRVVDAIPLADDKDKKSVLKPSLLESPIEARPPVERETPDVDETAPKTGAQLADQWEKDLGGSLDLTLAPEPGTTAAAPAAG